MASAADTETGRDDPERMDHARRFMDTFLRATGVVGDAPGRRYLWTDAFAVCTLLELHRRGARPGDPDTEDYEALAIRLVDDVHHTLGCHREDDPREGWLSGLEGDEAEAHPTAGGLRIGKALPEKKADAPFDRRLEWERDGQYFHYLTRWMHALLRVADHTDDSSYLRWAVELARAADEGCVRGSPAGRQKHIAWKMSVDLSRPLVGTSGRHDPLDGYVTFRTLAAAADRTPDFEGPGLSDEILDMAEMVRISSGTGWATDDPLGLGGLLVDAWRLMQLRCRAEDGDVPESLPGNLLDSVAVGLRALRRGGMLEQPPAARLPFREIGLAIGIHALERMQNILTESKVRDPHRLLEDRVRPMTSLAPSPEQIEETWLDPDNRLVDSWAGHADINGVMLATSLVPEGYLTTSG